MQLQNLESISLSCGLQKLAQDAIADAETLPGDIGEEALIAQPVGTLPSQIPPSEVAETQLDGTSPPHGGAAPTAEASPTAESTVQPAPPLATAAIPAPPDATTTPSTAPINC